jgi:hypothetical protein
MRYQSSRHTHGCARDRILTAILMLMAMMSTVHATQHRLGLLELYTSEGCNSCPPADQWLSRMRTSYTDRQVIPLAFHVDYWNQLGWPDRFSDNRFTQRQQQAANRNHGEFVYTPQFLLDGKDIRPVHAEGSLSGRLSAINKEPARTDIRARAAIGADRSIELSGTTTLHTPKDIPSAETYVVLYEQGLFSKVAAGENAGKTLQHDYVVRALLGPIAANREGIAAIDRKIPFPSDTRIENLGIAVFTQDRNSGTVLQATAEDRCFAR